MRANTSFFFFLLASYVTLSKSLNPSQSISLTLKLEYWARHFYDPFDCKTQLVYVALVLAE